MFVRPPQLVRIVINVPAANHRRVFRDFVPQKIVDIKSGSLSFKYYTRHIGVKLLFTLDFMFGVGMSIITALGKSHGIVDDGTYKRA
jgi:hypothetical protein